MYLRTVIEQDLGQAQERGAEARELVGYAWYKQKGPDAKRGQIYVRKSNFMLRRVCLD